MRARWAAVCLGFALMAAAPASQQPIVGVWYEEVTYGGSRVISILNIKADGSYRSVHRRCLPQGKEEDDVDNGRWTYADGRLRLMWTGMDGWPAVDEYETEANDGRVWVYRGVAGHGFDQYGAVKFRDLKVGPQSKLPTCDLSS